MLNDRVQISADRHEQMVKYLLHDTDKSCFYFLKQQQIDHPSILCREDPSLKKQVACTDSVTYQGDSQNPQNPVTGRDSKGQIQSVLQTDLSCHTN